MSLTAILWVIGILFGLVLLLFVSTLVFQAVANLWPDWFGRRRSSRSDSGSGGYGWGDSSDSGSCDSGGSDGGGDGGGD